MKSPVAKNVSDFRLIDTGREPDKRGPPDAEGSTYSRNYFPNATRGALGVHALRIFGGVLQCGHGELNHVLRFRIEGGNYPSLPHFIHSPFEER